MVGVVAAVVVVGVVTAAVVVVVVPTTVVVGVVTAAVVVGVVKAAVVVGVLSTQCCQVPNGTHFGDRFRFGSSRFFASIRRRVQWECDTACLQHHSLHSPGI